MRPDTPSRVLIRAGLAVSLLVMAVPPVSAAKPPAFRVDWRVGGMSAPYEVSAARTAAGAGAIVAGYTGGIAAVGRSGMLWRYSDGTQLAGLSVGDLTGDGIDDVAVGQYDKRLTILDGSGGDVLLTRTFPGTPEALAIADATGDGRDDLYVVTQGRGTPSSPRTNHVALLDGRDFQERWLVDLGVDQSFAQSAGAGDFDGDGLADIAFGTYSGGPRLYAYGSDGVKRWDRDLGGSVQNISITDGGRTILAARGGATLTSVDARTGAVRWQFSGTGGFSKLETGDLNGDQTQDAVWTNYGSSGKSPLYQVLGLDGTSGLPIWARPTVTPPKGLAVGDVDGDGRDDVAVTTQDVGPGVEGPNFVWAYEGRTGRPLWSHPLAGEQTTFLSGAALADVAGDSRPEVVVAPYFDVLLGLAGTDGATVWTQPLGSAVATATSADLDGDGTPETVEGSSDFRVTARNARTGETRWTRDLEGQIYQVATVPTGKGSDVLAIALSTVFRIRGADGAVLWSFPLQGLGTAMQVIPRQGQPPLLAVGARARRTERGIGNNNQGGQLVLLEADSGVPAWQIHLPGSPWYLGAGDLDADGASDLAVASPVPAQGVIALDGATLATAPVPLWRAVTDGAVTGLMISGRDVLTTQATINAVVALDGAVGMERWRRSFPTTISLIGSEDVTGDGRLDPLVSTEIFLERVAAVDGASGEVRFHVDVGMGFVRTATWADVSGDGEADLVYASDGGVYGTGGVAAIDGRSLGDAEPPPLWTYELVNAVGLTPVDLESGPSWLAFGHSTMPDALAMIRSVPGEPDEG